MTMIALDALQDLATRALARSGASAAMAAATARALVTTTKKQKRNIYTQ